MTININKNSEKIPVIVVVQSFLVAVFADIKTLNYALTYGGFVGDGIMSLLYPSIIVMIIISVFFSKNSIKCKFNKWSIFIPLYIFFFYFYTKIFIGDPHVSILLFITFVIAAFFVMHFTYVNTQIVLKIIMILPFFSVFKLDKIFVSSFSWLDAISMDCSYSYLVPTAANIVYMLFYFKNERLIHRIITIVFTGINVIILSKILLYGSRGPILCLTLLLFFLWLSKVDEFGFTIKKRKILFVLVLLFCMTIMLNEFIYLVDSLLESFGLKIRAITKIMELSAEDNISNGRSEIIEVAMHNIWERPFFGWGLDRFQYNTGIPYPHNFIIQIFYDGGILLFVVLSPIIYKTKKKFLRCNKEEYILLSFLLFSSVPAAFFSQDLWKNTLLWMFFGSVITNSFILNKDE